MFAGSQDCQKHCLESLGSNLLFVLSTLMLSQKRQLGRNCTAMPPMLSHSVSCTPSRVCLVNDHGHVLLDSYVHPGQPVTDYRTFVSGIRKHHLDGAPPFQKVQSRVAELASGRTIVGHALHNDLQVLEAEHVCLRLTLTDLADARKSIWLCFPPA